MEPSTSRAGPSKGRTGRNVPKPSQSKTKAPGTVVCVPKKPKDYTLPAFSLPLPKPTEEQQMEKQKMMRRNKPKGEDLKKLKEIVAGLGDKTISVQEFIALVAPYTGDKGELLQTVVGDELENFRDTARKIYDTMTQDISEVLTNEHIQLKEHCDEKQALLREKIQRKVNAIYAMCPDFDFKRYDKEEKYLEEKFPIPTAPSMDSEEMQARMRQEAFHRYQWLKSEGDRLKQENTRLQKRLGELKKQQKMELQLVADREQDAEDEREVLEEKQGNLENMLDELNESVGQTLVESELETNEAVSLKPLPRKAKDSPRSKETWATQQAAEIEGKIAVEAVATKSSIVSSKAKTALKGKKKAPKPKKRGDFHFSPIKTPPPKETAQSQSPFHYSPPREQVVYERAQAAAVTTPKRPTQAAAQRSPFHFSPIRSPPPPVARKASSPFHYSPNRPGPSSPPPQAKAPSPSRVRVTRTSSTTEPQPGPSHASPPQVARRVPAQPQPPVGRRVRAPKDSWGGFY